MLLGKIPLDPELLGGMMGGAPMLMAPAAPAPEPKIIEKIITKEVIVEKPVPMPMPAAPAVDKKAAKENVHSVASKKGARTRTEEEDDGTGKEINEDDINSLDDNGRSGIEDDEERSASEEVRELERQRLEENLKAKYDAQLAELERLYSEQKVTNEKLEEEFERLNAQYEAARAALTDKKSEKSSTKGGKGKSAHKNVDLQVEDAIDQSAVPKRGSSEKLRSSKKNKELSNSMSANSSDSKPLTSTKMAKPIAVGTSASASSASPAPASRPATISIVDDNETPAAPTQASLAVTKKSVSGLKERSNASAGPTSTKRHPAALPFKTTANSLVVPSDGQPVSRSPPPVPAVATAVVGADGVMVPAIITEEGIPLEVQVTASGMVEPICGEDGRPRIVRGANGLPAPQVFVIDEPIAVVGPEGDAVLAVRGQQGQAVHASMGPDGRLRPAVNADGSQNLIFGPDGFPAREVAMPPRSARTPRWMPMAVIGPDGEPILAVLENDVPVRAELNSDGVLVPVKGSDGRSVPIQGPNGSAPQKVEAAVAAVVVARKDGSTVLGAVGSNGELIRAEVTDSGVLRPVVGTDGVKEIVEDVIIPAPMPPPQQLENEGEDMEYSNAGTTNATMENYVEDLEADAISSVGVQSARGSHSSVVDQQQQQQLSLPATARRDGEESSTPINGVGVCAPPSLEQREPLSTSPNMTTTNKVTGGETASPQRTQSALVRQLQQKLLELEGQVVAGGQQAGNKDLKENIEKKKKRAQEKELELERLKAAKAGDDDTIIEEIYGSMQEELKAKNKKLYKMSEKLKGAKTEISDLQSEFERERDDLLETVRRQQQQLKLFQQLVDKVSPLIRRDCNYSNIDRIIAQAQWNEDTSEWMLPRVSGGTSAGPHPHRTHDETQSANHNSRLSQSDRDLSRERSGSGAGAGAGGGAGGGSGGAGSSGMGFHSSSTNVGGSGGGGEREDDAYLDHLRSAGNSTYFQTRRAAQLLDSLGQRQREASLQQEQRLSRFDNIRPLTSNRSIQLLNQDPLVSLELSPKNPRRREHAEPGGVPLNFGGSGRSRRRGPMD